MTTDNFCFYFQNRLIQTNQTGGQWYSDTSQFSIPCIYVCVGVCVFAYILLYHTYNCFKCSTIPYVGKCICTHSYMYMHVCEYIFWYGSIYSHTKNTRPYGCNCEEYMFACIIHICVCVYVNLLVIITRYVITLV
jgi:hypothetical protein